MRCLNVEGVDAFFAEKLDWIESTLQDLQPRVRTLLANSEVISEEPAVCEGSETALLLERLATAITSTKKLRKFVVVNKEALRKIVKKYKRWHSGGTELIGVRLQCAGQDQAARLARAWDSVRKLNDELFLSCSSYYEYLQDTRHLQKKHTQRLKRRTDSDAILRKSRLARMIGVDSYRRINVESTFEPAVLLALVLIVPLVTFATTYFISSNMLDDDSNPDSLPLFAARGYFLSASIDKPPASNIGTLGLSISLTIIAVVMFLKHKMVSSQLRGLWTFSHRVSLTFGMLSYVGGMGVAAYQYNLDKNLHLAFAGIFFVSALIHMLFEVILMTVLKIEDPRTLRVRQVIVFMCIILCPLMIVCLLWSHRFERFSSSHLLLRNTSAGSEITMFILLLVYFGSYYAMFRRAHVSLRVIVRSPFGVSKARRDWLGRPRDEQKPSRARGKKVD